MLELSLLIGGGVGRGRGRGERERVTYVCLYRSYYILSGIITHPRISIIALGTKPHAMIKFLLGELIIPGMSDVVLMANGGPILHCSV